MVILRVNSRVTARIRPNDNLRNCKKPLGVKMQFLKQPPPVGEYLLQHKLLPHQQQDPKYQARCDSEGNIRLSNQQRSWIDSMLRKKARRQEGGVVLVYTRVDAII